MSREEPVRLFIDGPISVYIYRAPGIEIDAAWERLSAVVALAALELQRELDGAPNGPQR